MAEPRSAAQEAGDPSTSADRLLELTEKHPQLQRLIVLNPSTPDVARQWILATNPWAKRAYEESRDDGVDAADGGAEGAPAEDPDAVGDPDGIDDPRTDGSVAEDDGGPPTAALAAVPTDGPAPTGVASTGAAPSSEAVDPSDAPSAADAPAADDSSTAAHSPVSADSAPTRTPLSAPPPVAADPDMVSAWGDFSEEAGWGGAGAAPRTPASHGSAPRSSESRAVRLSDTTGVVPLGPAPSRADGAGAAGAGAAASGAAGSSTAGTGAAGRSSAPSAAASDPTPTAALPAATSGAAPADYGYAPAATPGAAHPTAGSTGAPSAPAAGTDGPVETEGGSSRRIWFACGGCLVLALLLVLVATLVGRAVFSGGDEDAQEGTTSSAEASPSDGPSEEPTEEETSEETTSEDPVSPAPEDAREMTSLASPTGNIVCELGEDSVTCSLEEQNYSQSDLEDCGEDTFSLAVADEDAAPACGTSVLDASAETLDYGESGTNGEVACTSRSDGMTCWNVMTGKGFMVSRSTYETF